jgi:hypothetical protein
MFGRLEQEDEDRYTFRLKSHPSWRYGDGPVPTFDVIQSTGKSVDWIQTQVQRLKPSVILCDSFYRQEGGGRRYDSDWKLISAVARRLKDMTMEENIVTIGTVQMNRGAEKEVGSLANMALSDSIGQEADAIFRVITKFKDGAFHTAIVVLGGREISIEGVMINSDLCADLTEIGPITSKEQVQRLLDGEANAEASESGEGDKNKKPTTKKRKLKPNAVTDTPQPAAVSAALARHKAHVGDGDLGDLLDSDE